MNASRILMLAILLCSGCASSPTGTELELARFLHDEAFAGSERMAVETREQVFTLDADAQAYFDRKLNSIRDPHQRGRALLNELFHQASLNLSYSSNANHTASETFHRRNANCLSMSILAYAVAQYTGFDARFQEVDIPEYWERRDSYSLMNQHINVRFSPRITGHVIVVRKPDFEVDFLPLEEITRPPAHTISENRVLAMFYNNKGVDALLARQPVRAYAYLKASLLTDPAFDTALANLGLLYATTGQMRWAEENYRQAHRINGENAIAAESLATLLRATGRSGEANAVLARLDRKRRSNPYYHYILGEEAYDEGRLRDALTHFEKALTLKENVDVFHFGIARTHFRLGNEERARTHLRRAERYANYLDLKQKYRGKLEALADL